MHIDFLKVCWVISLSKSVIFNKCSNYDYEAKLYLYCCYRTPGIQAQLNCLKKYKKRIRITVIGNS